MILILPPLPPTHTLSFLTPFNQTVLRSVVGNGKRETVLDKLYLFTHRCGDTRVSFAIQNRVSVEAVCCSLVSIIGPLSIFV